MTAELVLHRGSELYRSLERAARERRRVFLAGLSGVGKSLMLQQLALIAGEVGRTIHLLQWDVARGPFETPAILARYPEVDGVTHAAIRKAVGLWAREGVRRWDQTYPGARHLLLGETPLIGNRLIELVQPRADAVEPLLGGPGTMFLVPAPSREVRRVIEAARAREMASPRHERERANAPPDLVRAHWAEIADVARQLDLAEPPPDGGYDPDVYVAVYRHLLRHRQTAVLPLVSVLPVRGSAYDLSAVASELLPTVDDVARVMAQVETLPEAAIARAVERWFEI